MCARKAFGSLIPPCSSVGTVPSLYITTSSMQNTPNARPI